LPSQAFSGIVTLGDQQTWVRTPSSLLVLPPFQLFEPPREFFMGGEQLAQANKSSHNGDVYLNGSRAREHTRKHGNSRHCHTEQV